MNALRIQGHLFVAENKVKEAIEKFETANQLKPNAAEILLPLAQALLRDNQADRAEMLIKELLEKDPERGAGYDFLYYQALKRGKQEEGEEILKLKIKRNPKQAGFVLQLAATSTCSESPKRRSKPSSN